MKIIKKIVYEVDGVAIDENEVRLRITRLRQELKAKQEELDAMLQLEKLQKEPLHRE